MRTPPPGPIYPPEAPVRNFREGQSPGDPPFGTQSFPRHRLPIREASLPRRKGGSSERILGLSPRGGFLYNAARAAEQSPPRLRFPGRNQRREAGMKGAFA